MEPREWLDHLVTRLRDRHHDVSTYDDYYSGRHPLLFTTSDFREAFGRMLDGYADNWCLPPGSPVVTDRGVVAVEDVVVGDLVPTHDGRMRPVERSYVRSVDEPLVTLRTYGSADVRITGNHPVYASKLPSLEPITAKYADDRHFQVYGARPNTAYAAASVEREWVRADELEPGDIVWARLPEAGGASAYTDEMLRLLGWYVAEGSVSDNGRIAFSLHSDEWEYADEIEYLLKAACGLRSSRVAGQGNDVQVVAYSKEWASRIADLGGRGCAGKRLAADVMAGPTREIMVAAWLGDGTSVTSDRTQLTYTTTSLDLAVQMQQMMLREGVVPSWSTHPPRDGRLQSYGLNVAGESARKLAAMLGGSLRSTAFDKAPAGCVVDGWVGYAVADVGREPYQGEVHDLQVADAHSFTLPGCFTVHNCRIIIDAAVERLTPTGFRFPDGDDAGETADDDAWAIWRANKLDSRSQVAFVEAMISGTAYLMVWYPDGTVVDDGQVILGDGAPRITVEHPAEVIVEHDPGDRDKRLAGLKMWGKQGYRRATLFLPDQIVKYEEGEVRDAYGNLARDPAGNVRHDWFPVDGESGPNPLGVVPIVPLTNRPRLLYPDGESELQEIIPNQDAINKLAKDMLVASEYGAFPQRWATGVEVPTDPETNEPIQDWVPDISRFLTTANPDARVGSLQAADLSNFVVALDNRVNSMASQSRTPPHYLNASADRLSGESMKAAEAGLVARVREKMIHFGEGIVEAMTLAFQIMGDPRGRVQDAVVLWADPETRTEAAHADAVVKKYEANIIPWQVTVEDLGYSPTEIKRMRRMRQREALEFGFGADLDDDLGESA